LYFIKGRKKNEVRENEEGKEKAIFCLEISVYLHPEDQEKI
jgi:hypothetical protein